MQYIPAELWEKIATHGGRLDRYTMLFRHFDVRYAAACRITLFLRGIRRLPPVLGRVALVYVRPGFISRRGTITSVVYNKEGLYTCTVQLSPRQTAWVLHPQLYSTPASYSMRVLPGHTPEEADADSFMDSFGLPSP